MHYLFSRLALSYWTLAINVVLLWFRVLVVAIAKLQVHFTKLLNHSCRWFLKMCSTRDYRQKKAKDFFFKKQTTGNVM